MTRDDIEKIILRNSESVKPTRIEPKQIGRFIQTYSLPLAQAIHTQHLKELKPLLDEYKYMKKPLGWYNYPQTDLEKRLSQVIKTIAEGVEK